LKEGCLEPDACNSSNIMRVLMYKWQIIALIFSTLLENLPGLRLVEMDNELVHEAACLAAELGLRGADSIYVAVALQLNLPLVTFDVDQRERAYSRISIRSIGERTSDQ
jgi:predicted nucleic acid-binding protein